MKIAKRPMDASERSQLERRRPKWPFGSGRSEAIAELQSGMVEELRFRARRAWDANECGPPCCPRQLLIETGTGEFVHLESWTVLPAVGYIGTEVVATRTPLRRELITFSSEGEALEITPGMREALTDLEGDECDVLDREKLLSTFKDLVRW